MRLSSSNNYMLGVLRKLGFTGALIAQMSAAPTLTFAQSAPSTLTVSGPVGVNGSPNCTIVDRETPPFYIMDPSASREGIDATWNSKGASVKGYLPRGTIVEADPATLNAMLHPLTELVSVKVLSAPSSQTSQIYSPPEIGEETGTESSLPITRLVNTRGHIKAADLIPGLSSLVSPGSLLGTDARKAIFLVRKKNPFINIPELEGRAVRLSQDGPFYATQKCCSQKPVNGWSVVGLITGHPLEKAPEPNCTYQPIFDLLKSTGTGKNVSFQFEKQFVAPTPPNNPACTAFTSALTPIAYSDLAATFNGIQTADGLGSAFLEKLQGTARKYALAPRRGCSGHGASRRCGLLSGNISKGLCGSRNARTDGLDKSKNGSTEHQGARISYRLPPLFKVARFHERDGKI